MLRVPKRFDRNAKNVRKLGDPADTGLMLISYMCERIGIENLADLDVLDVGCGVRFTQSFINRNVPVGTYTGLEVDKRLVRFLARNVKDHRFSYHYMNVLNRLYNPNGQPLENIGRFLPGDKLFDIACMFSVVTHLLPIEASPTFRFLHSHLQPTGHLFFSAFIHEEGPSYQELDPKQPGARSSYSLSHMTTMLEEAGFSLQSVVDPRPRGIPIMTSFLCRPAI